MPEILHPRENFGQEPITVDPYTLARELDSLVRSYGEDPSGTLIDRMEGWRIEGIMRGLRYALEPATDWEGHPAVKTRNEDELRDRLQFAEEIEEDGKRETSEAKEAVLRELFDGGSAGVRERRRGEMEALRWVLGIRTQQITQA